jgi:TonB-dependent Receptor Plug Domain
VVSNVAVDVASERRVDVAFKTGQVSERVEVQGEELTQLETTSAEIGGTITSKTIENLPVNGRDYTKLIYLNPGVAGSPDQISDSPGSFGTFSMNGSRGRANNFLLDGTDMNDGFRNDPAINEAGVFGDPATILPIDAIAELNVISNYGAEYGRNSGAVINIVTKSGTNQWHGSALEFNRTSSIGGARNFFNTAGSQDPFHNNQFGGSLGGPIIHDRTFFYADYEGQRESGAQSGQSCVPDPRQIAADEAAPGFVSNSVITALLARNPWPAPNIADPGFVVSAPGTGNDANCVDGPNLALSTLFNNSVDSFIGKVDHNFNTSNLLTGRYYFGNSNQSFPFAQLAGGLLPGFNTTTPTRVQLVSLSWVKVVNSQQVNEARLGWNRFVEGFFPQDKDFNPASIGLDTGVTSSFDYGLPKISTAGFSVIGATTSVPRSRVDSNWHFIDNYSWKSGKHDIKFGYEFRRTTIALVQDNTFRGKLSFDDLADFLQGVPSGGTITDGDTKRHSFENSHGLYVQDAFRWTPRLTLTYGVRWDYFGVVGEKNNLFYQFDPASQTLLPAGQLYNKDLNNFAPRLGFAYDVTGKGHTVVRGGWGLFYDAFAQDIFLGHVPYNCSFCPGPAYTGLGAAAITTESANTTPLSSSSPVFSGPSPLGNFFGTDKNIRTPYTQNFNLNVEQQIGKAFVQVGYVGARGTKLFRFRDINQPSQAQITAADLANGVTDYGVPRNFPAAPLFYINEEESSASSTYHALQTSFHISNWRGVTSAVNFVWSHSIDNASDSEDFIPNASQPQDSTRASLDRGNSNFDIRRRFTWNFGYELPKMNGELARLKNGWGFNGVLNLQDGQPFQLNYNFEGDYSGAGEGFDRPDVVGPIVYGKAPSRFLDLTAFSVPCTFDGLGTADTDCVAGTRHFGDLGRNSLRGPAFKELNFSIFKKTPLTERVNLQFNVDFFNILNHPNFANPNLPNFITDPAANGISTGNPLTNSTPCLGVAAGRGCGSLGLTATGDVGIGNPFLGGGGPRGTQFSLKLIF